MKRKLGSIVAVTAIAVAGLAPSSTAYAQSAYDTSFQTSITYQNVGNAPATIQFEFYPENNGTPTRVDRTLATGASSSIFVGGLTELANFRAGSAVVSSDQPIVATTVQIAPSTSPVRNRLLSNGFNRGSNKQLIATVLKNRFNSSTKFSVQNSGTTAASGTIKFFNADAGGAEVGAARQTITNLAPGAARYFDASGISALPSPFNGSATIEMTSGEVVAAAMELSTNGVTASAFESVTEGATKVFMPSALCDAFGGQRSAYAVQNTSATASTTVSVQYSNGGAPQVKTIGPGAKASFITCEAGVGANFSGSATITSSAAPIVAVSKVYGTTDATRGFSAASLGATQGAARIALPYVRFTQTQFESGQRQRTYIAIQNLGAELPAGSVTVKYIDKDGRVVGAPVSINVAIPQGGKVNSNPSQLGAAGAEFGYSGTQYGGGAIIEGPAGSQLIAVARVLTKNSGVEYGEDYNGTPIQ